jgi:hypothetical protein
VKKLLLIVMLFACSCKTINPIQSSPAQDNPNANVSLLFTHDGCKVYRFTDGRNHYFAKCEHNASTETNWTESCGKSCTQHRSSTIETF